MDILDNTTAHQEIDQETQDAIAIDRAKGDFRFPENHKYDAGIGLNSKTIDYISDVKKEKDWIREFRHKALGVFEDKPMPTHWATDDLENIEFDKIRYYLSDGERPKRSWDDVPEDIKETFERLGIPEQERAFLAGVEAQFDSEAAYSNVKEELSKEGVIFVNSTEGLREHEEVFRPYFGIQQETTNSQHSTPLYSQEAPSSTSQKALNLNNPSKHTSESTPKTSANSSAHSSSQTKAQKSCTWKAAPHHNLKPLHYTLQSSNSSHSKAQKFNTSPYKTGHQTSSTSSPNVAWPTKTQKSAGSTVTSVHVSP